MGAGPDALILMAKAPVPGAVKTRLSPPLSPEQAASLYRCFLVDTAEELSRVGEARRYLFFAPPGGGAHFQSRPFRGFGRYPQSGGDLGERMSRAAEAVFRAGARRAVLVGADCPALSAARVRDALGELASGAGAVFGPSADGGFYLAGLGAPLPGIFRGVPWSTDSVLREVAIRCAALGLPYALLPPERDVDTVEDARALLRWTAGRVHPPCPRTRRRLRRLSGLLR